VQQNRSPYLFATKKIKPIISVSRRTDIPAYYGSEFMKSIQKNHIEVKNPFNQRTSIVSLKEEDIGAFVFWSKNFKPFLKHLEIINDLYQGRFVFHFTVNNFKGKAKSILEPNIPPAEEMVDILIYLSENYGKEKVFLRFDPIIFSTLTPPEERLNAFGEIIQKTGKYIRRCYTSFIDIYSKVEKKLRRIELLSPIKFLIPKPEEQISFLKEMKAIVSQYGIDLFTCCEEEIGSIAGVKKGHCVDAKLLEQLFPDVDFTDEIRPTRKGCGCYYSIDIGEYNTCKSKCLYCYANR